MFRGDLTLKGSPFVMNIMLVLSFLTTVLCLAQEDDLIIPILDVIQSICCFKSFVEMLVIIGSMWCFRYLERMMGSWVLGHMLIYSLIVYLPVFSLIVYFTGFRKHITLAYFIPYPLFIYVLVNMPAVKITGMLTDKILVVILYIFLLTIGFPYSFAPFITSILSNFLFQKDIFRMQKLIPKSIINDSEDSGIHADLEDPISPNPSADPQTIATLASMGFTEAEAAEALQRADGNVEQAINYLLESQ